MVIIDWLSNWASAIIVAVIIGTIIEMILPQGNSKKYIKVVIGIYVLFTIVSPLITKFTGKNIEISDILDLDTYVEESKETVKIQNIIQNDNVNNIKNIYSEEIKNDMKAKIKSKGYNVTYIDIDIANDESYTILALNMSVEELKNNEQKANNKNNINKEMVEEIECVNKIEISIQKNTNQVNENVKNKNNNEKNNSISNSKKDELKEYLSGIYNVKEECITIN